MFTATLVTETVDLRAVDRSESLRLYREKNVPWRCRGCQGTVHMRRQQDSPATTGLITFAHNPGEAEKCRALGFHTDESPEHHELKDRLAKAATQAGWDAELEVYGDGCRADVVVSKKGASSRVLEAQLATLSERDAVERSERYLREFGQPTWTHTGSRPWSKRVESLRVDDDLSTVIDGVYVDQAGDQRADPAPLATVIPSILTGTMRYVFYDTSDGTIGYFTPIGAPPGTRRRNAKRQKVRGEYVTECSRPLSRTVACVDCGHEGSPGRPCVNDACSPPSCPGCGRRPWHELAVCPDCGALGALVGRTTWA